LAVDVWIAPLSPLLLVAASFSPSEEDVMEVQGLLLSLAIHVTPLSVDV